MSSRFIAKRESRTSDPTPARQQTPPPQPPNVQLMPSKREKVEKPIPVKKSVAIKAKATAPVPTSGKRKRGESAPKSTPPPPSIEDDRAMEEKVVEKPSMAPKKKKVMTAKPVSSKKKSVKPHARRVSSSDEDKPTYVCCVCGAPKPKVKSRKGSKEDSGYCREHDCWKQIGDIKLLTGFHGQPLCILCLKGFKEDGKMVHKAARATFIHPDNGSHVCAGHYYGKYV